MATNTAFRCLAIGQRPRHEVRLTATDGRPRRTTATNTSCLAIRPRLEEASPTDNAVDGTTTRRTLGLGPCRTDKTTRMNIRITISSTQGMAYRPN